MSVKKNTSWTRMFKIKRVSDGLFKDKGNNKNFSNIGGTWRTKGLLRSHITMNGIKNYHGCMIVEYQLEEVCSEMII